MELSRFRTCRYVLCFSALKATTTVDVPRSLTITLFRAFVRIIVSGFLFAAVLQDVEGHLLNNVGPSERNSEQSADVFMNQFAVKVAGGRQEVDRIADVHGFVVIDQIGSLENYYLLEHHSISKRSLDHSPHHHSLLEQEPEVEWVEQQVELRRRKRDMFDDFRGFPDINGMPGMTSPSFMRNQFSSSMVSSPLISSQSMGTAFPDPMYGDQWYLNGGAVGGYDMNVQDAWRKGITGKGVVVSILDDGVQTNHPDLIQNYDPLASTDINGNDDFPMPQDNGDNKHGTRCAGEVAATAYNGICGVGIAYNASIGGVRMLDGTVNDAVEARALSHNPDHIDIYSASWGPEDDGKTVDGPGPLARKAFLDGVTKGRRGKGSIFIWASGNGGRHDDNCNCDGYTNSIYTLSISSATQHGLKPWYLEECSSTLATTYSSGTPGLDQSIVTVDMDMTFNMKLMCTKEHTGTSASAPIAAGICALALEANSHLTWRDMQYLVVLTSNPEPMSKEAGWITNGVRRKVSHKFGYGLMNAAAIVSLAEHWPSVPPQHVCEMPPDNTERLIPNEFGASAEFYLDTDGCYGTRRVVNYLEHVQAKISLNYNPRGNLRIVLQSPYHTSSTLLFPRPRDMFKSSFDDWPFLSVHFWGERPAGRWRLTIINSGTKPVLHPGVLKRWSLVFYGTDVNPIQRSMTPIGSMDFMPFAGSSLSYSTVLPSPSSNNSSRLVNDAIESGSVLLEKSCHSECLGGCLAPGADNCISCKHLSVGDGKKKVCVAECAEGWYATPEQECHRCHYMCRSCSGGSPSDCLTCQQPLLLLHIGEETQCTTSCPAGFFEAEAGMCSVCSSACQRCETSPGKCTECSGRFLLFNNTCITSCPSNTYNDGNGRCIACEPICDTCFGPGVQSCLRCRSDLFYFNGTCLLSCPLGYYTRMESRECFRCNGTCNVDECLTCWPNISSDEQLAIKLNKEYKCQQGTYFTQGRCIPCHVSCHTCFGPSYAQCSSCLDNKYLYKNVCLQQCPSGFYPHSSFTCLRCPKGCLTCSLDSEKQQCNTCLDGYVLYNGDCHSGCSSGMFNVGEGGCLMCHESCLLCNGTEPTNCLLCHSGKTLILNECHTECALNYFHNGVRCVPCHSSCRTCKGDGEKDCVSCHESHILDGGNCKQCSWNQFFHPILEKCVSCNEQCLTCNGPDANSCLTCVEPLKHHPLLQRCIPCCNNTTMDDCCYCDQRSDYCVLVASVNNKRRINDEAPFGSGVNATQQGLFSMFQFAFIIALVGSCLVLAIFFTAIFAFLQGKSSSSGRSSIRYSKIQSLINHVGQEECLEDGFIGEEEITADTALVKKI